MHRWVAARSDHALLQSHVLSYLQSGSTYVLLYDWRPRNGVCGSSPPLTPLAPSPSYLLYEFWSRSFDVKVMNELFCNQSWLPISPLPMRTDIMCKTQPTDIPPCPHHFITVWYQDIAAIQSNLDKCQVWRILWGATIENHRWKELGATDKRGPGREDC